MQKQERNVMHEKRMEGIKNVQRCVRNMIQKSQIVEMER
jgi:hypothetical protein